MIGIIGKKLGMTQVFEEDGSLVPVTVVKIEPNTVIGQRTVEKNGYSAVLVGAVDKKKEKVLKPVLGQFPDKIAPKRYLKEIRDFDRECQIGDSIGAEIFEDIKYVDVSGVSKGKGFQGVMKRHGFGGGRKTHGSKFHRAGGSTGMAASPSRVMKGVKMAGHMGSELKKVQNLKLVRVDSEKNLLLIKGSVPGARNSMVMVYKAKKKS